MSIEIEREIHVQLEWTRHAHRVSWFRHERCSTMWFDYGEDSLAEPQPPKSPPPKHLILVLAKCLGLEHTFSCENAPAKQQWIMSGFPDMQRLCGGIEALKRRKVLNIVTESTA